jgi:hypothetical protein
MSRLALDMTKGARVATGFATAESNAVDKMSQNLFATLIPAIKSTRQTTRNKKRNFAIAATAAAIR